MASRCTGRFLPQWPHLLRAVFAAAALAYTSALIFAEQQYAWAWQSSNMPAVALAHVEQARKAFPLDHRFRSATVEYYARIRWKGSRSDAIAALRAAIAVDPLSFDLHRALAGFLYENGDMEGAQREILFISSRQAGRNVAIIVNSNPATN